MEGCFVPCHFGNFSFGLGWVYNYIFWNHIIKINSLQIYQSRLIYSNKLIATVVCSLLRTINIDGNLFNQQFACMKLS